MRARHDGSAHQLFLFGRGGGVAFSSNGSGAIKSVGQTWLPDTERDCVRLRTSRSGIPVLKASTESRTFERAAAGADTQPRS